MTCWWEENRINIEQLDTEYSAEFTTAINEVIAEDEEILSDSSDFEDEESFDKRDKFHIASKNHKFEENKSFRIKINSNTNDESFEGGEDDNEEVEDKAQQDETENKV